MKFEYKAKGFRAVLCTGNRANIKIHISQGKSHTNPIADKIDSFSSLDVMGTVFQKSCSSIFFRMSKNRPWEYVNKLVKYSIEATLGRPVFENEMSLAPAHTSA